MLTNTDSLTLSLSLYNNYICACAVWIEPAPAAGVRGVGAARELSVHRENTTLKYETYERDCTS